MIENIFLLRDEHIDGVEQITLERGMKDTSFISNAVSCPRVLNKRRDEIRRNPRVFIDVPFGAEYKKKWEFYLQQVRRKVRDATEKIDITPVVMVSELFSEKYENVPLGRKGLCVDPEASGRKIINPDGPKEAIARIQELGFDMICYQEDVFPKLNEYLDEIA